MTVTPHASPLRADTPAPSWLAARRAAAAERHATAALPTTASEIWRYSRIDSYDPDRFRTVGRAVTTSESTSDIVGALSAHPDGDRLLGSVAPEDTDAFTALAIAALHDGLVVDVPAGVVVSQPVRIRQSLEGVAPGSVVASRLIVRVGAGAEATVIDICEGETEALFLPTVELEVGEGAHLRYVSVQSLGSSVWQIGTTASRTDRDAELRTMAVALGGDYARLRTDATLAGKGASNELLAAFFGEGTQMHDFRTVQYHEAPRTTSDLLFKGAVEDRAASVYTGLIRIGVDGQRSVANQTNRNLILSADASAESVPNLEILNNDVKCSHASAIGPIDEEQRYYLESRGVAPAAAERLIVLGFFTELLARVPDPELADALVDAVRAKFERRTR